MIGAYSSFSFGQKGGALWVLDTPRSVHTSVQRGTALRQSGEKQEKNDGLYPSPLLLIGLISFLESSGYRPFSLKILDACTSAEATLGMRLKGKQNKMKKGDSSYMLQFAGGPLPGHGHLHSSVTGAALRASQGWRRKTPGASLLHSFVKFWLLSQSVCAVPFQRPQVIASGILSRTYSCHQWKKWAWWASGSWPASEMT